MDEKKLHHIKGGAANLTKQTVKSLKFYITTAWR